MSFPRHAALHGGCGEGPHLPENRRDSLSQAEWITTPSGPVESGRLAYFHSKHHLPLALVCFGDVHEGEVCHCCMFAEWWASRPGQVIEEL